MSIDHRRVLVSDGAKRKTHVMCREDESDTAHAGEEPLSLDCLTILVPGLSGAQLSKDRDALHLVRMFCVQPLDQSNSP